MEMKRFIKISLLSLACTALLGAIIAAAYVLIVASDATLDEGKLTKEAHTIHVLDYAGAPIDKGGDYAKYNDIPADLVNAFVAVEDKRFYRHNGLDYRRIIGAAIANLKSKSASQGASTITCQLVKNTHLTQEKTLNRKIKEAKLALEIEKQFSKEEILEMYLNVIYLGGGCYGVKSAANRYFAKDLRDLSLTECAALAAITVNPSTYSPLRNAENNQSRRDLVLTLMAKQGYITEEQAEKARNVPLELAPYRLDIYETYRINAIDEAARLTGLDAKQLATGYTVYTYCDTTLQAKAHQALYADYIRSDVDYMTLTADVDGRIRAFCSTFDVAESAIRRQIGSTIKPFIYASAIEQGLLLPDSVLIDEPQAFGDYTPHNYHDVYHGRMAARDALAKSANVAAVKTLGYAGIDRTFDFIQSVGLPLHNKDKHLGLALGGLTYGCTMDELASAYCTLAAGGVKRTAAFVDKVLSPDGAVVYRRQSNDTRVLSNETSYLLTDMLAETIRTGTARKLGSLHIPLAAKTGTVESVSGGNSDAWCAAYTPTNVCIAWAGNLSMESDRMTAISGGGDTATIVQTVLRGTPPKSFTVPKGIVTREIDDYTYQKDGTLQLASPNTPDEYRKSILASHSYPMDVSRTFEQIPSVDCRIHVDEKGINIAFEPSEICTYQVIYDNGFEAYLIDEIIPQKGQTIVTAGYDCLQGWWALKPVLHGKIDIEGQAYRALVM